MRRVRVAFANRRRASGGVPLDAWARSEDDQAAERLGTSTWFVRRMTEVNGRLLPGPPKIEAGRRPGP